MQKDPLFLVENYAFQINQAFDIYELAMCTSLNLNRCRESLKVLIAEGKIITSQVNTKRKMYLYNPSLAKTKLSTKQHNLKNLPSSSTIQKVKDNYDPTKTHLEMANIIGCARSTVSMSIKIMTDNNEINKKEKGFLSVLQKLFMEQ